MKEVEQPTSPCQPPETFPKPLLPLLPLLKDLIEKEKEKLKEILSPEKMLPIYEAIAKQLP